MTPIARFAKAELGQDVGVIRTSEQAAEARRSVQDVLRRPLTADNAVRVALLNNRGLQAAFNDLAAAEAQAVGDSLPPNPMLLLSRISGGGAVEIEGRIVADVLALTTLPARAEIAQTRFRQAQLRAIEATLSTAADARRAFYRAVAANEVAALRGRAEDTAKTTARLASELGRTGALNKLDQAREQVFYAEAAADLANARQEAAITREQLVRALGLWGADLTFRLPATLPPLPQRAKSLPSVEADTVARRIDLQIARLELETLSKSLDLEEATRFVSMFELAGISKETKDSGVTRERGVEAEFQIPIFDLGTTGVRRAEAEYLRAVNRLTEKAVAVRSQAREAYRLYRSSYDIAAHYQNEILPLRKIITDESQLRFSAMQADVFELLQEARLNVATQRAAIEAKRAYWLAAVDLSAAVMGGTAAPAAARTPVAAAAAAPAGH